MKTRRKLHIVLALCAAFAAAVLFATYGTVLPSAPLASIQLNGPTVVDSNNQITAVVDTESHRALILNADGDMTGVVSCATVDSPFDVITDVCISNGLVYLSGAKLEPDSDAITKERVATYDKGGNFRGVVFEIASEGSSPEIKALNRVPDGVVVIYEKLFSEDRETLVDTLVFDLIGADGVSEIGTDKPGDVAVFDAAIAADDADDEDGYIYATLSARGMLGDGESDYDLEVHAGHVFTAIDIDENGILYACDDETGALWTIAKDSLNANKLVDGTGYHSVHENGGVISLCNTEANTVVLCDASGTITSEFAEVKPSIGLSARMLVVWASALYLVGLALVLGIRKLRRQIRAGKTEGFGPMFAAVAIVMAIAVAIGNLSFASYQKMLDLRASEINMLADYLEVSSSELSEALETVKDRDALRKLGGDLPGAGYDFVKAAVTVEMMAQSAQFNGIGIYCTLYCKDDKGIFYLHGSAAEYVMGTSARGVEESGLQDAFEGAGAASGELLRGRTLRDATQYRLVTIPTVDGKGVAGVIEIGSKVRSFESSIAGDLAQRILGLLVMVLVVYLAYSELRACGRCLFSYRKRQQEDGARAAAMLTRPFTLAITMLASIDSVMTVLIARDLLTQAGMDDTTPLLAVPAVMLGVGLILGQGLYAITGSRVGLRRLVAVGALIMMACACITGAAVASGIFWLYCAAKLVMSVPFGMLYSLGYSLPRLATDGEMRVRAISGVRHTDTSAAALGTVLGGYAAQMLDNVWVYALVAVACLPVILMAVNLLPRGMQPLEKLAQPDSSDGHMLSFVKTPIVLGIALFIVLPATLAAGYASFLFPLFSSDLGLSKAGINNIFVLGQLVVYVCIDSIDRLSGRHGLWKAIMLAVALLGAVFLLFAVNTTIAWSIAVIALVGLFGKTAEGWKIIWLKAAGEAGVPIGRATSAMFATRSLALIVQPFILGALLGASDSFAVIVIGLICAVCAGLFFLVTRRSSLAK